jgi:hypothetical protein
LRAILMSQSESRTQAGQVTIWLDPGPDDAKTFTKEHQAELREVLGPLLRDKGLEVKAPVLALYSADAVGGYTGQLIIALASIPAITKVLVAWIQRKPGRKIRFHQNGQLEVVEAHTEKQILSLVKALQQEARAEVPKTKTK